MKKIILSALALSLGFYSWASYNLRIHKSNGEVSVVNCTQVEGMSAKNGSLTIATSTDDRVIPFASLDSLTFKETTIDTVYVVYQDDKVDVINPDKDNIDIKAVGAGVTVNSVAADKEIVYALSGKSSDGYFLIDSEKKFKVVLNRLNLTSKGAVSPIRSLSGKGMTIVCKGWAYLSDTDADTCNAVIRSKGQILFDEESGKDTLRVIGKQKRAIQSGDYIVVKGGILTCEAPGDCVRTNDYFLMDGGELYMENGGVNVTNGYFQMDGGVLNATAAMDDVKLIDIETEFVDEEGDTIADATHGAFYLNGGTIALNVKGDMSKGVKTDGDIIIKGGSLVGVVSGSSVYENGDASYSSLLKAGGMLSVLGGKVDLKATSTADGARLISADGKVSFKGTDVSLKSDATVLTYMNSKGNTKTKAAALIKTDRGVEVQNSDLKLLSTSTTSGAIGMLVKEDVALNEGANLLSEIASNATIYDDADDGFVTLRVAEGATMMAISKNSSAPLVCEVGAVKGVAACLSTARNNPSIANGSSCIWDSSYENQSFVVMDAAGKVILKNAGAFDGLTGKYMLFVMAPFDSAVDYQYVLGAKMTGEGVCSGFVTGGSVSGGETYSVDKSSAKYWSVVKE